MNMLYKYKQLLENVINNNKVIAHITGPSGAGKTTILSILQDKYPQFEYVDIDDIEKIATKNLKFVGIKRFEYTDNMYKRLSSEKQRILNKLLKKSNKQWIIVGHHVEYPRSYHAADHKVHIIEGIGNYYKLDIPTNNRFFLKITPELSAQRFTSRQEKNGKTVSKEDVKLLTHTAAKVIKQFKDLGYKEVTPDYILNWFEKNI